jgi:hypothetical protein
MGRSSRLSCIRSSRAHAGAAAAWPPRSAGPKPVDALLTPSVSSLTLLMRPDAGVNYILRSPATLTYGADRDELQRYKRELAGTAALW